MKLKQLFSSRRPAAQPLYGAIVAAARQPFLYGPDGAPDTADGRLGMIVLHLGIAIRRLGLVGRKSEQQDLVEAFFVDVEGNLRESGVSDVAIPRRMREIEAIYIHQMEQFEQSAKAGRPATGPATGYIEELEARLACLSEDELFAGKGWVE